MRSGVRRTIEVLKGQVQEFWWTNHRKFRQSRKRKVEMIAQVTTFIDGRGFGFLTDSAGEQYFFHVTNFLREGAEGKERKPKLGEMVSFELADPVRLGRNLQAVKIRPSDVDVQAGIGALAVGLKGGE